MCSGSWPNFNAWLDTAWGNGYEFSASGNFGYVIGLPPRGTNPPYYLDDFLGFTPKFFGLPTALTGCGTTSGSATLTVSSTNGLLPGQFLTCPGVPKGTVITTIGTGQVTLSNNAGATASGLTVQVYQAPPVPIIVIQLYLNLAVNSLFVSVWGASQWPIAIGFFIAHYCTLYAQTDESEVIAAFETIVHGETPAGTLPGTVFTLSAPPPAGTLQSLTKNGLFLVPGTDYTVSGLTITLAVSTSTALYATWLVQGQTISPAGSTGAQIAAQGLAGGIQTSKSVGDVSVSYQPLESLKDWGAWNLTKYGQQLATMASVVGSGPMLIW